MWSLNWSAQIRALLFTYATRANLPCVCGLGYPAMSETEWYVLVSPLLCGIRNPTVRESCNRSTLHFQEIYSTSKLASSQPRAPTQTFFGLVTSPKSVCVGGQQARRPAEISRLGLLTKNKKVIVEIQSRGVKRFQSHRLFLFNPGIITSLAYNIAQIFHSGLTAMHVVRSTGINLILFNVEKENTSYCGTLLTSRFNYFTVCFVCFPLSVLGLAQEIN